MGNIRLAEIMLTKVIEQGVTEFCVCAGARNAPLVSLLDQAIGIKVHHFFEERSAAFFALGRIHASKKPVAIVTTSGTAAAELLPAAIEAHYVGQPLLLITADRPRSYRKTGAPQTIEQVGLFGTYVENCIDIENESENLNLLQWSQRAPLHINICFNEPLLDSQVPRIHAEMINVPKREVPFFQSPVSYELIKPLVIVGPLAQEHRDQVVQFLIQLKAPIYAEVLSGLRGVLELQPYFLNAGEKSVEKGFAANWCQSVLRLGGVPTLRFWRDLEDKYSEVPVYSISNTEYSGLSRKSFHFTGFEGLQFFKTHSAFQFSDLKAWDEQLQERTEILLEKYPESEPGLINILCRKFFNQKNLYIGNSLPIREMDLVSPHNVKFADVLGNRGANGIDGQISTFLGWAKSDHDNWILIGDLTAMYDLSAPWIADKLQEVNLNVVIINNGGGQIFKKIFGRKAFLNEHQIGFESWAKMWNWNYIKVSASSNLEGREKQIPLSNSRNVIEVIPSSDQTDLFWQEYGLLQT